MVKEGASEGWGCLTEAASRSLQVRPVHSGTATLKDATSEAIRDWVTNVETTHYILGSAAGPHPYPMMVRDFQAVIGEETRRQCEAAFGGKPDILLACVGGGSNAIGLFHEVCNPCLHPLCLPPGVVGSWCHLHCVPCT